MLNRFIKSPGFSLLPLYRMIPYSFGAAIFSALSGVVVSRTGQYRPVMWLAFAFFTIGYGLMVMLDSYSSTCVKFIMHRLPRAFSWQKMTEQRKLFIPSLGPQALDVCSRYGCSFPKFRALTSTILRHRSSAFKRLCQWRIWLLAHLPSAFSGLLAVLSVFQLVRRSIQVYVPLRGDHMLTFICIFLLDFEKEGCGY